MATTKLDLMLARVVVQQRLVPKDTVDVLIRAQDTHSDAPLAELLVEAGVLSAQDIPALLETARAMLAQDAQVPRAHRSGTFAVPPNAAAAPAPAAAPPRPAAPAAPAAAPAARSAPVRQYMAPPKSSAVTMPPRAPAEPPRPPPAPAFGNPRSSASGLSVLARVDVPKKAEPAPGPALMDLDLFVVDEEKPATQAPALQTMELPADEGMDPREEMQLILRVAGDMAVSDLHLFAGHKVVVRQNGRLLEQPTGVLDGARVERLVRSVLTSEQAALLQERGELDFACTSESGWRFRANAYKHQRGWSAMFRPIPAVVPTLQQLGLPPATELLKGFHNGLVLFTGPAGCGKSTSMAALVHLLNTTRSDNIITIEDPIEFLHTPRKAAIIQRQVGEHTASFARALHGALREDPDVIVVGELRDLETMQLALTAAETGHLVLATLHTNNAVRTINRIISAFPPNQQDQVRGMLGESLRGVLSQRLLPTVDGSGLAVAAELLLVNRAAQNLIKENKALQLRTLIQTSGAEGMVLLDSALAALVSQGRVTAQEAARHAEEPRRIPGVGGG